MSTSGEEKVQKLITESVADRQGRSYHEKQEVVARIVVALKHNTGGLAHELSAAKLAELDASGSSRVEIDEYQIRCLQLMECLVGVLTKANDVLKALEKKGVHRG